MIGGAVGSLALSRAVAAAGNLVAAAAFVFVGWRVSRSAANRRHKAGSYVACAAVVAWALWRLWAVCS